jgi:hypothetical protein
MLAAMHSLMSSLRIITTSINARSAPGTRGGRMLDALVRIGACIGFGVAAYILLVVSTDALSGGAAGWDGYAYWLAGMHVRTGQLVYAVGPQPGIGAFLYAPVAAQLMAPLSLLPWPVFSVLIRLAEFGALRGITGSWRATGLWLLFPPVLMEINLGNVVLLAALAASLALRGWSAGLPLAAVPKVSPAFVAPVAWRLYPASRRTLVISGALMAAALAVSFLIAPDLWHAFTTMLANLRIYGDAGSQTGFDSSFVVRMALALALIAVSMTRRWPYPRTASMLAVFIGIAALRLTSLAMLAALPLLFARDIREGSSPRK